MKSETELLADLAGPDMQESLLVIYKNYCKGVLSYIVQHGGSEQDGYDIFQDSVLALVRSVKGGTFRGDSSIKTFIHSIAKNKWLMELRTRSRREQREKNYGMTFKSSDIDTHHSIHERELNQVIEELFSKIGSTCRQILKSFYFENKKVKELMVQFSFESEQVMRNKKSLCLKKVKELLKEDDILSENLKTILVYGK
jgi:RNA polymerase sigma factor (sigma-70 family)